MAVRMRRAVSDEDKGIRREEILDAAKRVFAEKGFHQTAIADIARAAELSYGSVYWYFDSKDALFQALSEREEQALWRHVAAALEVSDGEDPERILARGVRATFEFFAADPAAAQLLSFERFTDDIERLVLDAQRRGVIVAAPAPVLARSVAGLISTMAGQLTADPRFDAEETADVVVSLLLNGLRPR
jgi:TetR/AcrR family fatty acid metabolism transcriptional regulator